MEAARGQIRPSDGCIRPQSTGKSSLLQWLLLLKQTKEVPDRSLVLDFGSPEQYVNLGTYRDVVHHNDHTLPVRSVLKWTLPKTLKISNPNGKLTDVLFPGDKMQVDSVVYEHGKQLRSELAYVFAGESFSSKPKVSSETRYQLKPDQDYERHTSL